MATEEISLEIAVNEKIASIPVSDGIAVHDHGTQIAQELIDESVQAVEVESCPKVLCSDVNVQKREQASELSMRVSHDNAVHTVLGIYRPKPGVTADEVLESTIKHYGAVEEIKEFLIAAIIRSLDGAYAGNYAHWKKGTDIVAVFHLPGLVPMLTEMGALADIEPVEVEVLSDKVEADEAPILSRGSILHIALLSTEPENQSNLIEALRTVLKRQKEGVDSLISVTIHKAIDEKKVAVITAWKDAESAKNTVNTPAWEYCGDILDQYIAARDVKLYEVVLVR